jgi:hypothetical protein
MLVVQLVVDDNVAPLPAGPVEPASADAADVFTMLLDHLSSRVGKGNLFEFWFDSLHRYYFILLYPEIFKHIGSLGQHEGQTLFGHWFIDQTANILTVFLFF